MLTEINFKPCYINGNHSVVSTLSDGRVVLHHSTKTITVTDGLRAELMAAGVSTQSKHYSTLLSSADAEGIRALVPGAVVDWENSPEYQARRAAARGSRSGGGRSSSSATASTSTASGSDNAGAAGASTTAGAVASSDAFQVPGVDSVAALADVLRLLPGNIADDVKAWGVSVGAAVLDGSECPAVPASCTPFLVMPSFPPSLDAYKLTIQAAAKDYAAKMAEKLEKEKAAAARAEAERRAKENGKNIVTLKDGRVLEVSGAVHKDFVKVAELVNLKKNVYLFGPAGTGKTYLVGQIADAFGLPYYRNGKTEDIYNSYTGVKLPTGEYQTTPFKLAWDKGGLYFQDEIDRCFPCAVDWLQTSLDERKAIFCDGTGEMTPAHENFICMAAANTPGLGPTTQYPTAFQMSPAFRRRFVFAYVGYDPAIDKQVAGNDSELLKFVDECRAAIDACAVDMVVSPEEIKRIKELDGIFEDSEIIEMVVTKFLPSSQLQMVAARLSDDNRWAKAFKKIANKAA